MRLDKWMTDTGTSDEMLAGRVGLDRSTISRVRRGKIMPSSNAIAEIVKATNGAVQPNDFFDLQFPGVRITSKPGREEAA